MEQDFEKIYHRYEKKHFWFRGRRRYIIDYLKKSQKDPFILDIGCSSGILLNELESSGFDPKKLYGIDISETAVNACCNNGLQNVFVMDAQKPVLQQKFDIIIASDCLEHLEYDVDALRNWHNMLKDEGILLLFVPAFNFLWSQHDIVNMHFRRYNRKELKNKLSMASFKIEKSSYWNFLLFFPVSLTRFLGRLGNRKKKSPSGNLNDMGMFNNLLFSIINFENKLLSHINFPWGVSVFCIAQKVE